MPATPPATRPGEGPVDIATINILGPLLYSKDVFKLIRPRQDIPGPRQTITITFTITNSKRHHNHKHVNINVYTNINISINSNIIII